MKKDIEWLKREIPNLRGYVVVIDEIDGGLNPVTTISLKDVYRLINQLDEPEVLSQEWIDKHEYVGMDPNSAFVYVKDLQNLIVPKQEEFETKIQELIESYKQEEDAYSNPENGWISGFIEDLKNLVEKEQKYYVDLDTAAYVAKWNGNDQVDIYTDGISGSDEFEFRLTEQEIKDYDERFWPFAVKVEELEE